MITKPTDSELEILQVLWQEGRCTVREVNDQLTSQKGEEIGYTTTLKLMQIMHEKGMVERDTSSRTHIYHALMNPEQTRRTILDKVIDNVFNGSPSQLILQALSNKKSSKEEIQKIRDYLNQLDKN